METLLLTVHSTGSGEIPLPKALALLHTMNLPDSKESCSALLQDSKTGRHSRRGSLQHKIPVVFFFATAGAQAFICSPPPSPLPFQNAPVLHKKLPTNQTWGCSHPPLGMWNMSTGGLRAGATAVGLSEDRMQQPARTGSSFWNVKHWETTSSCHWQKASFFPPPPSFFK